MVTYATEGITLSPDMQLMSGLTQAIMKSAIDRLCQVEEPTKEPEK